MPEELWRPSLDLSLHRNRNHPEVRLVQLATVRPDGRPAIRTVVFRGFLDDAHRLVFTTDVRSAKRAEIAGNPHAAVCWYFPETREQFRIAGVASLVDATTSDANLREARDDLWAAQSEATRLSFTWPSPGEPRDRGRAFPSSPPDPALPVESFGLLILTATEVDHLELLPTPHHRWQFEVDDRGRWSGREVNP
ncbi:Npun_F5749 family FMN-dependent PPOX-type flavoprotein [Planctomyces sp. SH-PL62]|uniref:Npun_F5749 family FMN-dependent PPOX-type flavoprotein n=1 Tax=Planctomyces sp. SH-PL62 TaxID=1636152 RepID=UPI00078D12BC|nr:Npun_F5749 family FMN-dependent PPOX-type flavoprotein [Planctomyces sp. SH-PL62]AMV39301.1 Pyridoxine/pyridoxamine 5'-phosphate oxidase [Planctomyces sp. SH-PL62]